MVFGRLTRLDLAQRRHRHLIAFLEQLLDARELVLAVEEGVDHHRVEMQLPVDPDAPHRFLVAEGIYSRPGIAGSVVQAVALSPDFVSDGTAFAVVRGRGLYRSVD